MFKVYSNEDFIGIDMQSAVSLDSINLFDKYTDELYYLAELAFAKLQITGRADGYLWVAVHGHPEGFAFIVYTEYGSNQIREQSEPSAEDLADIIKDSGLWNGEPIVLLSCNIGRNGYQGPAYDLSYYLGGCTIYAPTAKVWFLDGGIFYVSDEEIDDPTDEFLSQAAQESMWVEIQY